jgi:hypothetical protein
LRGRGESLGRGVLARYHLRSLPLWRGGVRGATQLSATFHIANFSKPHSCFSSPLPRHPKTYLCLFKVMTLAVNPLINKTTRGMFPSLEAFLYNRLVVVYSPRPRRLLFCIYSRNTRVFIGEWSVILKVLQDSLWIGHWERERLSLFIRLFLNKQLGFVWNIIFIKSLWVQLGYFQREIRLVWCLHYI